MLFATLTLLVAGVSLSKCLSCDGPGVVPAPHPNKFALCTYNDDGDLVAQVLPCSDSSDFTHSDRWELVSQKDCVVRRRREALNDTKVGDSNLSQEVANDTEAVQKDLSSGSEESSESQVVKLNSTDVTEKALPDTTKLENNKTETTTAAQEQTTGASAVRKSNSSEDVPTGQTEERTSSANGTSKSTEVTEGATDGATSPPTESVTTAVPTEVPTETPAERSTEAPAANQMKLVECWYPGITCTSCSEAAFCVGTGSFKNGFPFVTAVATLTCAPNEVCVDLLGCVSDENRLCTRNEFSCTDSGLFPDPYDCRLFHSCVFLNGAFQQDDVQCLSGAYNSKTSTCGYPLNTPTCLNRPVPHCKQEFEIGALPSNPNIYYICVRKGKTLSPSLFRCPGGAKFTTALFSCVL